MHSPKWRRSFESRFRLAVNSCGEQDGSPPVVGTTSRGRHGGFELSGVLTDSSPDDEEEEEKVMEGADEDDENERESS